MEGTERDDHGSNVDAVDPRRHEFAMKVHGAIPGLRWIRDALDRGPGLAGADRERPWTVISVDRMAELSFALYGVPCGKS